MAFLEQHELMHQHVRRAACIAMLGVAVCAAPALAKRAPSRDDRVSAKVQPVAERAGERLSAIRSAGGLHLQVGDETGLLRRLYRRAPSRTTASPEAPRTIARRFLVDNAAQLGLVASQIDADLSLAYEKTSPSGAHLRWNQVVNGVPVYRSEIVVKVSPLGEVSSVQNNLRPGIALETTPGLDADRAIEIGVNTIGPTGKALGPLTAQLRVVDAASGVRLAYLVSVPVEEPLGDWLVFVDALTGAVFGVEDRMLNVNGTGRVFDPDPETKTDNPSLPDNNDADSGIPFPAAYDTRTLQDITLSTGVYSLSGPYAKIVDFESPVIAPVTATHADSFQFTRSPDSFEDVHCYFHIDQNERYIQSLGFTNVNNRVQEIDSHGLSGADNSHYIPSTKRVAFGDGGVDDAEDADVVIHEYGHSIQDNIVPGWGGDQEGAMGEGFGDYWAGSYSRSLFPLYQPTFVFNWDGHNEFWPGRALIDSTLHYPEDCCGEVHDSGTLWCSGLWNCLLVIGRPAMDAIVIDHHFALGTSATMADAANQLIQSDIDLFAGAHLQDLVRVLDFWGFVDAANFIPTITHTPLTDTENTTGPYPVVATITSVQPLNPSSLRIHYGIGAFTDSLTLTPAGPPNQYTASIPGPLSGVDVRYYLTATDSGGGTATHPAGAPGSFHQFHVGPDTIPPAIAHTVILDSPWIQWPNTVNATVTDNLGVNPDSVRVDWQLNSVNKPSFYLVKQGVTNDYKADFPSDTSMVVIGDQIDYTITARDVSVAQNTRTIPASGTYSFKLIDILGVVLVLDDDELPKGPGTKVVADEENKGSYRIESDGGTAPGEVGKSAASMAQALNDLGYSANVEPAGTSNPASWPTYSFIVSASGGNESPVANSAYRAALESYVAGGGKLLVEGGEVEYDAASSPGYPTFAANVLHTIDWDADNAGALNLLAGQTGHPLANLPNAMPSTMAIAYTGFGSEDSYKPSAPAYIVYGVTAQAGNGGILVYDDNPAPQSAQIVVYGFDYKDLADSTTRTRLLENTAAYLMASEGAADGGISGRVILAAQSDHSGAIVTASPGGASDTTDAAGNYEISGLYATTYTVTASKAGYVSGVQAGVVVTQGNTTPNVNLALSPQSSVQYCLSPGLAIPENDPAGVTSVINVVESFPVSEVEVAVDITHTYIGDLIVEIRHGVKTVRLHNRTGGSTDNIVGTYPTTLSVSGPGTLGDFLNDSSDGAWTLFVSDNANIDIGTINSWCITIKGVAQNLTSVDPGSRVPVAYALSQSLPNPAPGGGAAIAFAIPREDRVSLGVFDVSGRLVRSLVDMRLPAGFHTARWDGRNAKGDDVAAGVYLYRLDATGYQSTRKLVIVR